MLKAAHGWRLGHPRHASDLRLEGKDPSSDRASGNFGDVALPTKVRNLLLWICVLSHKPTSTVAKQTFKQRTLCF